MNQNCCVPVGEPSAQTPVIGDDPDRLSWTRVSFLSPLTWADCPSADRMMVAWPEPGFDPEPVPAQPFVSSVSVVRSAPELASQA